MLRVGNAQLVHQELKLILDQPAHVGTSVRGEVPGLLLEWAPRLLARLVDELLVRLAFNSLVRTGLAQVVVDVLLEIFGECAAIKENVLELSSEVHFQTILLRELVKGLRRQGRCTMLDSPAHAFRSGNSGELLKRIEVKLDSCYGA